MRRKKRWQSHKTYFSSSLKLRPNKLECSSRFRLSSLALCFREMPGAYPWRLARDKQYSLLVGIIIDEGQKKFYKIFTRSSHNSFFFHLTSLRMSFRKQGEVPCILPSSKFALSKFITQLIAIKSVVGSSILTQGLARKALFYKGPIPIYSRVPFMYTNITEPNLS
jgi:hypothetical protein